MRLTTLGTGGYTQTPGRGAPAALVEVGQEKILVDVGENAGRALVKCGVPPSQLTVILLTHYHLDHLGGLAPLLFYLRVEAERREPVPRRLLIGGPPGLLQIRRGFMEAFGKWMKEPGFPLEWRELPAPGELMLPDGSSVRYEPIIHATSLVCQGYRFSLDEKSLAVAGDTCLCPGLRRLADGVDLLLCDSGKPEEDEDSPHITTRELGTMAKSYGVKKLILTHFTDPEMETQLIGEVRAIYDGELAAAADGMTFEI